MCSLIISHPWRLIFFSNMISKMSWSETSWGTFEIVFTETVFHRAFSTDLSPAVAVLAWKVFETLYVYVFYIELYSVWSSILHTFYFFLFCCVCVSFKCQDKKCPREHASQLNKQNKISLKIVLIIFLAWISVEGATSLRLLTRKKSLKQKGVIFIFFSCFFTCNLIQQFHKFSPICMIWSSVAPIGAFGLILQHSLFSALKALVRGPAWSSLQNVNEMEKFGFKKKNQEQWLA